MDRPLISPNWLTSTTDLEVGVQAFRRVRKIARASGIVILEALLGPAVQSDEEIAGYLREAAAPLRHASATCKMGSCVRLEHTGDWNACQDEKTS